MHSSRGKTTQRLSFRRRDRRHFVNQLGHTTYDTLVKDFVRFRYKNTATRSRPAGIQSNDAVRVRVTSRKVRESRHVQAQKVWYLLRQQGF